MQTYRCGLRAWTGLDIKDGAEEESKISMADMDMGKLGREPIG